MANAPVFAIRSTPPLSPITGRSPLFHISFLRSSPSKLRSPADGRWSGGRLLWKPVRLLWRGSCHEWRHSTDWYISNRVCCVKFFRGKELFSHVTRCCCALPSLLPSLSVTDYGPVCRCYFNGIPTQCGMPVMILVQDCSDRRYNFFLSPPPFSYLIAIDSVPSFLFCVLPISLSHS